MFFRRKKITAKGSLNRAAWRRFSRNYAAMAGLIWVVLSIMVAMAGYLITPDQSPHANRQMLEVATRKPGFEIDVLKIRHNTPPVKQSWITTMVFGMPVQHTYMPVQSWHVSHEWLVAESFAGEPGYPGISREVSLPDIVFAIDTDHPVTWLTGDSLRFKHLSDGIQTCAAADLQQRVMTDHMRSMRFLLGTDRFGRDMLSQLIIGMRVSLSVGFIAVFISLVIGITLGSIGGYFRGWIDDLIVWIINVVWSIPTLLLAIAITFALGKGFWQVFVAVGLTMWVEVARVVRGQIISVREKEYVEAARALGLTHGRIITRHILPNIMGAVVVISAANFASAILIEAGLSFLGIGVQPPMPSWGTMIRDHYGYIILDKGFLAILPGTMIMLMVLAFMVVGNGLREALDKTART